jgi:hypothetical protein
VNLEDILAALYVHHHVATQLIYPDQAPVRR